MHYKFFLLKKEKKMEMMRKLSLLIMLSIIQITPSEMQAKDVGNGSPCEHNGHCKSGFCKLKTCRSKTGACARHSDCSGDYYCDGGKCHERRGPGADCVYMGQDTYLD